MEPAMQHSDMASNAGTSTAAGSSHETSTAADNIDQATNDAVQQPKKAMPALPPRTVVARQQNGNSRPAAAASGTPASSSDSSSAPARQGQSAVVKGRANRGPSLARSVQQGSTAASNSNSRAMPSLPARAVAAGSVVTGVIDPEESESTQKLRANVHDIRVRLIRAARRLGYEHDNGLVKQVLYRLYLAEKLKEPFRKGARRPDAALLAARDATRLETEQGPNSPLDLNVKILVIGLRGTGKTQLIRSLLSMSSSSSSSSTDPSTSSSSSSTPIDAFGGATKRVEVRQGTVLGITLTMIDTPGLTAGAAGAAANAAVLRGIKKAFKQHQPDLVLYVDRFDQPSRAGGELSVLQAITNTCGAHIWLNTIVALTHAGTLPPSSGQGHMSWDAYSQQRSQMLQLIIRSASGDARLMNPIAFAESHPGCRRDSQGQAIIPSGLAWQQHMLVLIVSAKLLADAEAALQMTPESGTAGSKKSGAGGLDAASIRQLMGKPEGPPVRYLMTQLTSFNQPLNYPDHGSIMELRNAKVQLRKLSSWRDKKELSRQIRFRLLQMQQMQRRQQRSNDLLVKATRAGGKLQLEQPRTANKVRPSVQAPVTHRYRALEPSNGWMVRPHIEPHGMDNTDNIEGFMAEKSGVWRPAANDPAGTNSSSGELLLKGAPYRVSGSISAGKEQMLMQTRGDVSVYHDLAGLASTTLSADMQTSGAGGTPDLLMILRMDTQRRGFPLSQNSPSAGIMLSRLAQECRPHQGPVATGVRLQDCIRLSGPGGAPVELDMAVGKMFCRPGLESDDAWGANAEFRTDARQLIGSKYSAPLSISGSLLGHRQETMAAVSTAVQIQRGRRKGIGGKLQLNSRGIATLGVQVRSDGPQWGALVGLVPLFNLGWDMLSNALADRREGGQQKGDEEQQQQQMGQHLPPNEAAAADGV